MKGSRTRLFLVLALMVSTLVFSVQSAAQEGGKVMPHEQPVSVGGDASALAYDSFNNPEYTYDAVQVPPTGVYYRQAGLSPDGTKIVAQKSWTDTAGRIEIVLMNPDGTGEVVISPGDSGTGDIYGYMNPFWSDDGKVVGFCEVHNANPNKVMRYFLDTATRDYVYQPVAPLDANNPDFVGNSTSVVVFWDWNAATGEADLCTWDGATLVNLTNSASYSEYEPVSNADGTKIVYWSGETTAEPVNTTHTLTNVGGTWTKDVGFTPIADTYWSYWSGKNDGLIATTIMSTKDIFIYDDTGAFVEDLSGPGYSGGSGQWNFFGSMPEGPNGQWLITSNAARAGAAGRDVVAAQPFVPTWTKYSGNPVVTGSMAFDPSVLKDGSTYKMWYTHVDNSSNWTIYYADSPDGVVWSNQQKVLDKGAALSWEDARVAQPTVIKDGPSSYKMWYMGRNAAGKEEIGYATSSDGLSWAKSGSNPVVRVTAPGWDSLKVRDPMVILDGGTYKMWYAGCEIWPLFKIGYATSTNGTAWTKHASNPIFTGRSDGWDDFQVYAPSVVLDSGTYHMYFSGTDNERSQMWSTGHATSPDGIVWSETARNPLLIPDGTDDSLDYVCAMNDGGTWKLWYSYGGTYAIGLATMDNATELYFDPPVAAIPNDASTTETFTIRIANAADLYGYQYVVTFDAANLECTDAAFIGTFFPTAEGRSQAGWNAVRDNVNGKVYFARTLLYPEPAVNGSGPLATLTLRSKSGAANSTYRLDFEQDKLADIESNVLPNSTQHAWLTLTDTGTGTITGQVDLQGRTTESGGTVIVSNAIGYYQTMSIVNADGTWSMSGIPVGGYQVNVEMPRYLDGQKGSGGTGVTVTSGGTTALTKVKLLGGDANDDDMVDISDGSIIGGKFGQTVNPLTESADINADGTVDIMDLVLFGGNYTWTSPVPWS